MTNKQRTLKAIDNLIDAVINKSAKIGDHVDCEVCAIHFNPVRDNILDANACKGCPFASR